MSVWTAGQGASCQAVLFYHIRRMLKGVTCVGLYKKKEPSWFIGIVTGIHILTSVLIALDNGWIAGLKCLFGVPLAFIMFILLTLLGVLGL